MQAAYTKEPIPTRVRARGLRERRLQGGRRNSQPGAGSQPGQGGIHQLQGGIHNRVREVNRVKEEFTTGCGKSTGSRRNSQPGAGSQPGQGGTHNRVREVNQVEEEFTGCKAEFTPGWEVTGSRRNLPVARRNSPVARRNSQPVGKSPGQGGIYRLQGGSHRLQGGIHNRVRKVTCSAPLRERTSRLVGGNNVNQFVFTGPPVPVTARAHRPL
eukprot:1186438-Prorocentrum_minimum.AAC.2